MWHLHINAVLVLAVLLAFTSAATYYVTPTTSTPCLEEGVHCFTLSQYATKPNFALNTTLILLPGNHSLYSDFKIGKIRNLTINFTTAHSDSKTSIICSQSARFSLTNMDAVSMRGLVLIGCTNNKIASVEHFALKDCSFQGQGRDGTGLELNNVPSVNIVRSSFSSFTGGEITWNPQGEFVRAGGAIIIWNSTVTISISIFTNNIFSGENKQKLGGAVYAWSSNITINTTIFNNNTVIGEEASGGAVYAGSSNITIDTTIFNNNTVIGKEVSGGALYAESSSIAIQTTTFNNNAMTGEDAYGGAIYTVSSDITIHTTTFNNNTGAGGYGASGGGAVLAVASNITICNATFKNNTVIDPNDDASGGAVYAQSSTTTIHTTTFNNNTVIGSDALGGAVYAVSGNSTIQNTTFSNNTATGVGGKINNKTVYRALYRASGGAVFALSGNVTMYSTIFNGNTATGLGGAIRLDTATLNSAKFLIVKNNMADIGGALYAIQSTMYFLGNTTISNNYGSLYAYSCNVTFTGHTNITNNSYSTNTSQEGGAVTAIQSEIIFTGKANLTYNIAATHGGGISVTQSKLRVYGDITIGYNTASLSGGGIHAYQSELNLKNYININNNSAGNRGGGIHVISSIVSLTDHSKTYFFGNQAEQGGGACLEMNSKLYIVKKYVESNSDNDTIRLEISDTYIRLEFNENSADYGGALYITDDTNSGTCHATPFSTKSAFSSECFMQGLSLPQKSQYSFRDVNICNTYFANNSARKAGHEIYGGLLDRCTVNSYAEIFSLIQNDTTQMFTPGLLNAVSYLLYKTNLNIQNFPTKMISSDPVRVCFCRDNQPDCSYQPKPMYVKKGEIFTVSLVAVDQVNNTISNSTIHAYVPLPASLGEEQSAQKTSENGSCTELKYSIITSRKSEVLSLYAEGPCMDIGISKTNIRVYIDPCPVGFEDIDQRCDCDRIILNKYVSNCSIDDQTVLRKDNVWFSYVNTSEHTHSYTLHKHCPFDYCRPPTESVYVNLTISNGADAMCAFNRSGKLCGSCKDGLSLILGSSRCVPCSNNLLGILIVFAIAGVTLIAILLFCNLTVAAGTINGLLFYANIVSSNKAIFFSKFTNRFFTIFIAWLNLDFGFETCFFNGLNGYWKIWLQLAFPTYVIFLVILVIKACEFSPRFARLIARKNPIATLDTLVLLSYTKFIHTIISAWQFATLEYSDGTHEMVWLVDATIKYFELRHIPLFVAALVIFMVALIYTLLLFLWQWLLLCPNRQPVRWIRNSKLHGIMDAYFITFNKNHRYWTGLLLLVRVLLYLVSTLNGIQSNDPRMNLYSITLVVGSLILWNNLTRGRIYRKWPLNVLDVSSLFNLLILTVTTFYVMDVGGNQTAVASISVSIAFITFILIISYHVYAFVLHNQLEKIKKLFKNANSSANSQSHPNTGSGAKNGDDDDDVTVSVVEVPLIPLDTEGNPMLDGFDTDEDDDWSDTVTTDSNHSTSNRRVEENQSQAIELEEFAADNVTNIADSGYTRTAVSSSTAVESHRTTSVVKIEPKHFTASGKIDDPLNMNEYSRGDEGEESNEYYDEESPLLP